MFRLSKTTIKHVNTVQKLRNFSASADFTIPVDFKSHMIEGPNQETSATKEELLNFHREMYGIRRMEVTNDQEYKSRNIRGFCHLYDGQEAVATGVEAALNRQDDWITTYRCHAVAVLRGSTYQEVFEELFGYENGVSRGKGGSMHLYNKSSNFYGGAAIVGAQVPVGTGLAFYHKYMANLRGEEKPRNVSVAAYGDGSANQGQIWEAANMAQLWGLPVIYLCENNLYGMGTSIERSSSNIEYYKQGQGVIPGICVDGMDVLAVRDAIKLAKEFCINNSRPIFVEAVTYRFHGHSMSDPGISYRTKDEVSDMRKSKDPIEQTKNRLIEAGFATTEELKAIEKEIRIEVQTAVKEAKKGKEMPINEMLTDIYAAEDSVPSDEPGWGDRLPSEIPKFIRMPDFQKSIRN
eukprot:maker-scaffold_88-snap-gene-0.43-mRNA-1 protein AED:0.01 eAED:0.01 QI:153/1/1/1/1/1/3/493/406